MWLITWIARRFLAFRAGRSNLLVGPLLPCGVSATQPLRIACGICLLVTLLCAGCSTHAKRLRNARQLFYAGDLIAAESALQEAIDKDDRDADALLLDQAMINLWQGQPEQAEAKWRAVRDRLEHLEQGDLAEGAWSLVTDDTRRAYSGEDYERVLLRAMLALSNLMGDGEDVMAYANQINAKQQQIIDRLAIKYDNKKGDESRSAANDSSVISPDGEGAVPPNSLAADDGESRSGKQVSFQISDDSGPQGNQSATEEAVPQRESIAGVTQSIDSRFETPDAGELAEGNETVAEPVLDDPRLFYKQVALGPYLHGLVREATHMNYDDAARSYAKVVAWQPDFVQGQLDLERAQHGRHSSPGHGVVYVIALVGKGPYKEEVVAAPTSQAMLIADRILSVMGKHSVTPTLAPIKVTEVRLPANRVDGVQVQLPNGTATQTEIITDLGQMAVEQSKARRHEALGRAVARRAVKKATLYATKSAVGSQGWTELAFDAVGVAWEASESADTRCWGLLPETIQVARIELPSGLQTLGLGPMYRGSPTGVMETVQIHVANGQNRYVMIHYPDESRVGEILQSDR